MDIRQILALEANSTSIKKIDEFLSGITPNHRDYPKALAHLAYLTFSLGNVSNAFTLLFNYLEVCIDKEKPTIYNAYRICILATKTKTRLCNASRKRLSFDKIPKTITTMI